MIRQETNQTFTPQTEEYIEEIYEEVSVTNSRESFLNTEEKQSIFNIKGRSQLRGIHAQDSSIPNIHNYMST